nr:hypothetical protein [Tanacetum cinerariifolium]
IDSLFDEFAGELTLLKSIPSGIDETDCHPEEETHSTKRLLYDNSSPRPPEEFIYDNSDADIESFSPSHIPVEDKNANQNLNRNGNLVAACAEGNEAGHNGNQIWCYNCRGLCHFAKNCTVRPRRRDAAYLRIQLLIAQKEEAGIQLQAEDFDLMATAADLDEIEEVNVNCILMASLQQASTSGTQTDKAPVYDSDGSAEHDFNGF